MPAARKASIPLVAKADSLVPSPEKFYKRGSQEKYLSCSRIFSYFPARVNEQGWFWPSAPWTRFDAQPGMAVWIFSPSGFHRVVATKPVSSETDKQNGCQVPTMVLSEARGL
jgi:hypothetical protein